MGFKSTPEQPQADPDDQKDADREGQPIHPSSEIGDGDNIVGMVGSESWGVAIGKYITQNIQIITQLGIWQVVILAVVLSMVIVAAISYSSFFEKTPPSRPVRMLRLFNVAIADFGQVDNLSNSSALEHKDGGDLSDLAFEILRNRLDVIPELKGYVDVQHEHIGFIPGETPTARQQAAAKLAQQINAHIVIYGYFIVDRPQQITFVPEFYISPRLTGAEELIGANAFGSEIPVSLPLEYPDHSVELVNELIPRFEALAEFMAGLAFYKTDRPDLAIEQLKLAKDVSEWKDKQGKEILYLWIGSTYNELALKGTNVEGIDCPIEGNEQSDDWECARAAYEMARDLNRKFARAYIGLGNLWLDQAEQTRGGQTFYVCDAYERAVAQYQQALDAELVKEAAALAFVELKTFYNMGLAYATAYRNQCGEQYYPLSVESLTQAVTAYKEANRLSPDSLLVRRIGAKSFNELGLTHMKAAQYEAALEAFIRAIDIAEPDNSYAEEEWQSMRWHAYNQKGHAYTALAEAGGEPRWQDAIEAYSRVITGYEERELSDRAAVSVAYYGLGTAYYETGQYTQALEALETSILMAEAAATAEPEPWQSLQWSGYLKLGNTLAALAEAGDTSRWSEALEKYHSVTARFEAGVVDVSGSIAAETYYRAGLAHEAMGDMTQAKASYEKAVNTEGVEPTIMDLSLERLQAVDGT